MSEPAQVELARPIYTGVYNAGQADRPLKVRLQMPSPTKKGNCMNRRELTGTVSDGVLAESIVRTIREPLIVLDSDFRVRAANEAFYHTFQVRQDDTWGRSFFDLGNRQWDIPALGLLLRKIIPEREVFEEFEVTHSFPHIGPRTMLLNCRLIRGDDPSDALILLAFEDVTERRRAEGLLADRAQELARSNADLEQFAYVASHDLQEPLRMVASYGDLLAARYADQLDERGTQYIGYIVDGAQRMQQLIDDLLAFARATRDGDKIAQISAEEPLRRALRALRAAVEQSGAVITNDPLPMVVAPPSQLQQVFQNLIGNAIKFRTEDQLRIHISARREGGDWRFSVQDNGIGIDPAHRDRIFGLFQRLHTRARYTGSGVGLALCKKIVEARGGRIWVEPAPDKGTIFFFTLPVEKGEGS
ncbi:MAG: ATP-binding protein [Actinomycetota bacterium]|nr:ATP-binding protein [Actinomycetota bacterium]